MSFLCLKCDDYKYDLRHTLKDIYGFKVQLTVGHVYFKYLKETHSPMFYILYATDPANW